MCIRDRFKQGISDMVEAFVDTTETQSNLKKAVLVVASVDGNDSALTGNGISSLLNYLKESNNITVYAIGLQVEDGKPASKAVRGSFTQIAGETGVGGGPGRFHPDCGGDGRRGLLRGQCG